MIGVSADFDVDHALSRLRGYDFIVETGGGLSAVPLSDASGAARPGVEGAFAKAGDLIPSANWR